MTPKASFPPTPDMQVVVQVVGIITKPILLPNKQVIAVILPSISAILPVRSRTIRCGRSSVAPCICLTTIAKWCSIAGVLPLPIHVHVRTARCVVSTTINTVRLSFAICQIPNDGSQLLLQDLNSLLDDRIWLKVSSALDFEVESFGGSIVVEGLTLLRRLFPLSILAFWPIICVRSLS